MALNKKKQDEKNLKMLREMVSLPHNKTCFDCHQRGPTYVNMATGSFVCTACSGQLRGLNPPHRVKSISMTSFTPEEMDFLRQRGNDLCRRVWLGLYDNRNYAEPDSKDETKIRDFMCQKYEKKRWYVAPTEAMYEEARKQNTPPSSQPKDQKLRSLVGSSVPHVVVNNESPSQASKVSRAAVPPVSQPPSAATPPQTNSHSSPKTQPSTQKPATGLDLLSDLGGDPFAQSANAQPTSSAGGFADFSAFNSQPAAAAPTSTFPPSASFPAQNPPASQNKPSFPQSSSQQFPPASGLLQPVNQASSAPTSTPAPVNFNEGGDRYAALANLDSAQVSQAPPTTTVNWSGGGQSGGNINWGGGGGSQPTSTPSMVGVSSTGAAPTSQGGGFGSFGGSGSAANPFGVNTAAAPAPVSNPFMAAPGFGGVASPASGGAYGGVPPPSAGGFGGPQAGAGFGGVPPSSSAGFGGVPPSSSAGFGGVPPSSNAGFGGVPPSSSAGFGGVPPSSSAGFGGVPPSSSAGFGGVPPSSSAGFGGVPPSGTGAGGFGGMAGNPMPGGAGAGFGAVPTGIPLPGMQNGSFGAAMQQQQQQQQQQLLQQQQAASQWRQPVNSQNMPASAFGAGPAGKPVGGGEAAGQMGSWGAPQAATPNPFMGAASQAQVPPRSHSSNPFL